MTAISPDLYPDIRPLAGTSDPGDRGVPISPLNPALYAATLYLFGAEVREA